MIVTDDYIFSSSYDSTAKAWLVDTNDIGEDETDKACIRTFKGHAKSTISLIYIPAPDFDVNDGATINPGDILITGSADCTAKSWSFDTGMCLKTFHDKHKGHRGGVTCMGVDSTGKTLFTGSADCNIIAWDLTTGKCLRIAEGHSNTILSILVTNRFLYSTSSDNSIKCWATETLLGTTLFRKHKTFTTNCMKLDKGILFAGSGEGVLRAYDIRSGNVKRVFLGHEAIINCLQVVGNKVYTGSNDSTVRVWDISDLSEDLMEDEDPPPVPLPIDNISSLERQMEEASQDLEDAPGIQEDLNDNDSSANEEEDDEEKEEKEEEEADEERQQDQEQESDEPGDNIVGLGENGVNEAPAEIAV